MKVIWHEHEFDVHLHGVTWNTVSGVYIFCGTNSQNQWVPLYIGQAESFADRIPRHERWAEAQKRGATHVHARVVADSASRDVMERTLISKYQPALNTHHL